MYPRISKYIFIGRWWRWIKPQGWRHPQPQKRQWRWRQPQWWQKRKVAKINMYSNFLCLPKFFSTTYLKFQIKWQGTTFQRDSVNITTLDIVSFLIHKTGVDLSTQKLSVQGQYAGTPFFKIGIPNGADMDYNGKMEKPTGTSQ